MKGKRYETFFFCKTSKNRTAPIPYKANPKIILLTKKEISTVSDQVVLNTTCAKETKIVAVKTRNIAKKLLSKKEYLSIIPDLLGNPSFGSFQSFIKSY